MMIVCMSRASFLFRSGRRMSIRLFQEAGIVDINLFFDLFRLVTIVLARSDCGF